MDDSNWRYIIFYEIENDNETRVIDSDDDDDFVPYPMKEESDEDDEDNYSVRNGHSSKTNMKVSMYEISSLGFEPRSITNKCREVLPFMPCQIFAKTFWNWIEFYLQEQLFSK